MKKIMYILSIGFIITLLGCGTAEPVKETANIPVVSTPTPAAEEKWVAVAPYSGIGTKETEKFTISDGSQYRLNWENNADDYLSIIIKDDRGTSISIAVNVIGISKDISSLHVPAGNYHLKIITGSGTNWKATIEKQQ